MLSFKILVDILGFQSRWMHDERKVKVIQTLHMICLGDQHGNRLGGVKERQGEEEQSTVE